MHGVVVHFYKTDFLLQEVWISILIFSFNLKNLTFYFD